MDPRILGAIGANGGIITHAELLDLGTSPSTIRWLKRRGDLVRLHRGVVTSREVWESLDEWVGRPLLVARSVVATMRRGWVLSHDSAALVLDLATLRPTEALTHITRPGWTNAWTENGVKHHLAGFNDDQVIEADGLRALDRARTAVDIGREHGFRHGLVACDSALRDGTTRAQLIDAYERMKHWTGIIDARRAVAMADGRAENPLETLGRELVIEAGIANGEEPDLQFPVRTAEGIRWCDIRVGNHVIETDGRVKFRLVQDGGFSTDPEATVWEERKRERLVSGRGLVVDRLVWEDLWGRRRAAAIKRIQEGHAESVKRFGPRLSEELAREAAEIRAQYGERRPA